jgi:hypothetical protein
MAAMSLSLDSLGNDCKPTIRCLDSTCRETNKFNCFTNEMRGLTLAVEVLELAFIWKTLDFSDYFEDVFFSKGF